MEKFVIEGGPPLTGDVTPAGNKNAALPILAATLLTGCDVTLHNVPRIGDVGTMLQLLAEHGRQRARTRAARCACAPSDARLAAVQRRDSSSRSAARCCWPGRCWRASARPSCRCPAATASAAAGWTPICWPWRRWAREIEFNHYDFTMRAPALHGADILLDEMSVTGTENAVMAAVLAKGTTIIRNAASEPHVQDLCNLLNRLGAQIEGIGSNTLTIHGVDSLGGGEFTISPDYIEVGSFLGLGAVTRGEIRIHGVVPEHMRMINWVFAERLGVRMHVDGDTLVVADEQELAIREDIGGAVPKIDDAPWPQFPADLMSIALVVATQARGTVLIHEKMFESRLYFVDKLIGMGAKIILCDPHRAVIVGPSRCTARS